MTLTDRQRAIVVAVHRLTDQHGYPPPPGGIGAAVGLSSVGEVQRYVRGLAAAGVLRNSPYRPRTVRLAPDIAVSRNGQVARVVWTDRDEEPARLINDLKTSSAAADGAAAADRTATTTEESSP
jgi:SOS-response transcriptional repressor LexA